jgi:hypothetical protein
MSFITPMRTGFVCASAAAGARPASNAKLRIVLRVMISSSGSVVVRQAPRMTITSACVGSA